MASLPLTPTDLRILHAVLANAHKTGRLRDKAYDRSVIVLAAAAHRLQEQRP